MLMYQWTLISSMTVVVSLKRWFESNHQYGSVGSRDQLMMVGTHTLNQGFQRDKPFSQFWSLKALTFCGDSLSLKLTPVILVGLITPFT
jgi:hypothetical protein